MRPFLFLGWLALGGLAVTSSRAAAAPPELKKLHVVLAFDTDSDLSASVRLDLERIRKTLEEALPPERYEIKEFTGKQLTRAALLAHFRDPRLSVGPDVGLVFFYSGYGARHPVRGQEFQLKHGPDLLRADLRKAMEERKPGLVVLLTDCYSSSLKIPRSATAPQAAPAVSRQVVLRLMNKTFHTLFYQSRGTVDVTGSDSASWGDDEAGGLFTRTLCDLLLHRSFKSALTWKEFFPVLQKETDATFQKWLERMKKNGARIAASSQKPEALSLVGAAPDAVVVTPAGGKEMTYAVISLENSTDKVLVFQYRWTNKPEWTPGRLASGGKVPVFVEVDGPLGDAFEMELKVDGRKGVFHLSPRVWKGKGLPSFADGELATISNRGE
jgi:hypothetical protein